MLNEAFSVIFKHRGDDELEPKAKILSLQNVMNDGFFPFLLLPKTSWNYK